MRAMKRIQPIARPRRQALPHLPVISSPTTRHRRQRAVVLILVVAVLGMLFVAGAALLTEVTFSTKTLDAREADQQNREVVEAVESAVLDIMTKSFLSPDGNPYNADTGEVMRVGADSNGWELVLPANGGEVPGFASWLDVPEPIVTDNGIEFKLRSNFAFALDDRPGADPWSLRDTADVGGNSFLPISQWVVNVHDTEHTFDVDTDGIENYQADADGDGIVDGYEFVLPTEFLPIDLRRAIADRLRDPSFNDEFLDTLSVTLKVVPHTGMVNLNESHDLLLRQALDCEPEDSGGPEIKGPYMAEANEWLLRYRGLMTPRAVPEINLIADLGQQLLLPHYLEKGTPGLKDLIDARNRHWWLHDQSVDTDTKGRWRDLVDPESGSGVYDTIHNVTTVSYDDLLIRSGKKNGKDWVEEISEVPSLFAWDDYPREFDGTADKRLGRIKLSMPYIDDYILSLAQEQAVAITEGKPLDSLAALSAESRTKVIRTIQDAFLLMLRNWRDTDGDGNLGVTTLAPRDMVIAVQAAMLTANLIDFADSDDVPTAVPVIGTNGTSNGFPVVYGFEKQPFITEIYASPVSAGLPDPLDQAIANSSKFAVELYNPYDTSIKLSDYELVDLAEDASDLTDQIGVSLDRLSYDALSGTLAPGEFKVFSGFGTKVGGAGAIELSDFVIDDKSIIALVRVIDEQAIVVDRMYADDTTYTRTGGLAASTPAPIGEIGTSVSIQRDTSTHVLGAKTVTNWRCVVPRTTRFFLDSEKTLGDYNWNSPIPSRTGSTYKEMYPVRMEPVNTGSLATAFPTTGSLLLVPRVAHLLNESVSNGETRPFNQLSETWLPGNLADDGCYDQIDNGKMPVFDLNRQFHNALLADGDGISEGTDALPWGQLLFDYFTALPLEMPSVADCDGDAACLDEVTEYLEERPHVDQGGLRVAGRINLNAASWWVMSRLPVLPMDRFPEAYRTELADVLGVQAASFGEFSTLCNPASPDDFKLAQAIVAYREARANWNQNTMADLGAYDKDRDPAYQGSSGSSYAVRRGYGFLTVGELLNIRHYKGSTGVPIEEGYRIDGGACLYEGEEPDPAKNNYVNAVARVVTLGDWITTKSHVFTIYGTIRGQCLVDDDEPELVEASRTRAVSRAIRFQSTVNRLPMFFGSSRPERIGPLRIEKYSDVRSN